MFHLAYPYRGYGLVKARICRPISVREHRWEPERLFMFVFTGYLDESGTHAGSAATVMGGLLARAEQWTEFEKKFAQAQKVHKFRVWHTKKFKNKAGDFKGWTDEQCSALYWHLQKVTSYGLTEAVAVALDNATYQSVYRAGEAPRKARFDTKYGLCFRLCLTALVLEVLKRKYRKKIPPLHIVLEAGHPNYGDAERIFLETKKEYESSGIYMLRTITKAEKEDCGQLMMADFTAHSEYLLEGRERAGLRQIPASVTVPRGMTGSTHMRSTPELLANLRAEVIEKATPKKGINAPSSARVAASEKLPS
jgi:hypothetical protein